MSYENGSWPPSCGRPASTPLTHSIVRKSDCSKWRISRSPFFTLASKLLLYQIVWSGSRSLPTPESALSTGNGTRISPSHFRGRACALGTMAYFHRPFRFVHAARTICGRGYPRQALSGATFSPQGVMILAGACEYAPQQAMAAAPAAAKTSFFIKDSSKADFDGSISKLRRQGKI